jgi:hypothetical protein
MAKMPEILYTTNGYEYNIVVDSDLRKLSLMRKSPPELSRRIPNMTHSKQDVDAHLAAAEIEFLVRVATDGTVTRAELYVDGGKDPLFTGISKRRKGDSRNLTIGEALALKRMFEAAVEAESQLLKRHGF